MSNKKVLLDERTYRRFSSAVERVERLPVNLIPPPRVRNVASGTEVALLQVVGYDEENQWHTATLYRRLPSWDGEDDPVPLRFMNIDEVVERLPVGSRFLGFQMPWLVGSETQSQWTVQAPVWL